MYNHVVGTLFETMGFSISDIHLDRRHYSKGLVHLHKMGCFSAGMEEDGHELVTMETPIY